MREEGSGIGDQGSAREVPHPLPAPRSPIPLIVPFWNRAEYLFPLLHSLQRAYIEPSDVWLCEDSGSADWIRREIGQRFPLFNVLTWPAELDPEQTAADRPWAKSQWHCVRSVNRVLSLPRYEDVQSRANERVPVDAFFYLESDCLVSKTAFIRLAFLWDWYHRYAGGGLQTRPTEGGLQTRSTTGWLPLAKIGGHRGKAWAVQRVYQPPDVAERDWVEDLYGGCWFGILNAALWRSIMLRGEGTDGPYDPRRAECDFADSFFDRNCQKLGARFLRTTVSVIEHQGLVICLNPHHEPARDWVGPLA